MGETTDQENQDPNNERLMSIDKATLTPFVRRTLGSDTVEVIDWDYSQIKEKGFMGGSVYRFTGNGDDKGIKTPWSLILKITPSSTETDDPSNWKYWKREPLVYRSGALDDLSGGLAAPRCLDVVEMPDEIWVWLEEVKDGIGTKWPLDRYGLAARHFGRFNGAYLAGKPLPSEEWFNKGFLRKYVATRGAASIDALRSSSDHPLVRRVFPPDISERIYHLWEEREIFHDALDNLPQTFCHLDADRRNLFSRLVIDGEDQTVAIDWELTGIGVVGEELSTFVAITLIWFQVEMDRAKDFSELVFEEYLSGLRDAGWDGDSRVVHLGYTASFALRNGCGQVGNILGLILNEKLHPGLEKQFGRPIEELCDEAAKLWRLSIDLEDEARGLIETFR